MKHFCLLLILVLTGSILFLGCSEEDDPGYEEKVAIHGYLYVNEPLANATMMITKTLPVDEYYDIEKAVYETIDITLENGATGQTWNFVPIDTLPGYYTIQDTTRVQENTIYNLTVVADGKTVSAQTKTPYHMEMLNAPPVYPENLSFRDSPNHPFVFRTPDPKQFGMVDAYCEEEWYEAEYINPHPGLDDYPEDEDEYEAGPNGEPRHIWGFSQIEDLTKVPEYGENVYQIAWYGGMFMFYGHYTLTILTMDKNYHNYIYMDHPELNSGIVGGIGVFASASRYQYRVYVVD
jgi:hypothetical protein